MELVVPIVFAIVLLAAFLIPLGMVRRAQDECMLLLRISMEESGMTLLQHRLIWVARDVDAWPSAVYWVQVEDLDGRRTSAWASIHGRQTSRSGFISLQVEVHWLRPPQFRLRTLMALVLYAAIDFGALHAVATDESLLGLRVFFVLTGVVPVTAYVRGESGNATLQSSFSNYFMFLY